MKRLSSKRLAIFTLIACGILIATWRIRTSWRSGYELVGIDTLGGSYSGDMAINEAGQIVGVSRLDDHSNDLILGHLNNKARRFFGRSFFGANYCFVRTRQRTLVRLDDYLPNDCEMNVVNNINENGWIVGCFRDNRQKGSTGVYLPFVLRPIN